MITNAENSRLNGLPTGCLVSIFTIKITPKSSAGLYSAHQKGTYPNFWQRPLSDLSNSKYAAVLVRPRAIDMALVRPSERYIKEMQTKVETESK